MKRLRSILLLASLYIGFSLCGLTEAQAQLQQNPPQVYGQTVFLTTAATAGLVQSMIATGVTAYQFACYPIDTVTTAGVTLQTSEDASTWTTTIASVDCANPNQSALTTASANYVRINATTFSATGSVRVTWRGLTPGSSTANLATSLDSVITELESANANLDEIEVAVEDTSNIGVLSRGTDTGGTTGKSIVTTAGTNGTIVNTAATGVYGITAFSMVTTSSYLRLYNAVAPPSACGATGFVRSYPIPPASAAGQVGGFIMPFTVPDTGSFTTGLSFCVTGGGTSSDNTAAGQDIYINIEYYDTP